MPITLNSNDLKLPDNYTMSDIGFAPQILEHVSNPQTKMMQEDFSSISFRYTERYRDLHPFIFQEFAEASATDLAMQSREPLEQLRYYQQVVDSCLRIDWGFHSFDTIPGHVYECDLYISTSPVEEMQLIQYLVSQDCDDDNDFRAFWRTALKTCHNQNLTYGGVKMFRAIYWMWHLSMFDHAGDQNPHSDEWQDQKFRSTMNQVVRHPMPFYTADDFGDRTPHKDEWLVSKNQAYSLAHSKQEGQLMPAPPK